MKNTKKKTSKCDFCGGRFCKRELTTFDGQLWCEDCLHDETTICADCDERIYVANATYVDDYPVCDSCYDAGYFHCESCGRYYRNGEYSEDGRCQYCLDDDKPESLPDNKRYYPEQKSRRDLSVGVEIEAEGGDYRGVYDDLAPKVLVSKEMAVWMRAA